MSHESSIEPNVSTLEQRIGESFHWLTKGVSDLTNSEQWKKFLLFQQRIPHYSVMNQLLIFAQKPDASVVMGFDAWLKLKRAVQKGEKGIEIVAPKKVKRTVNVLTEIENESGIKEKKMVPMERQFTVGFRRVFVYDVSQTAGEPIPQIIHKLTNDSSDLQRLYRALMNSATLPVRESIRPMELRGANGFYVPSTHEIVIRGDMPVEQKFKTLVHELAHAEMHNLTKQEATPKSRALQEIEAESVAFLVSHQLGLDTSKYSFGYVAVWNQNEVQGTAICAKTVEALLASGEVIKQTTATLTSRLQAMLEQAPTTQRGIRLQQTELE